MSTGGTIAKRPSREFGDTLESYMPRMADVLPALLTPARIVQVAKTVYYKTPDLQKCDTGTILASIMTACELGFEPGGAMKQCYLVPYGRECQLLISYIGYLTLARRSGEYASIESRLVHESDRFDVRYTPEPAIDHVPSLLDSPGKITHVYAYARLRNGSLVSEVMTASEVERIRQGSRSKNSPAWRDHWGEMAKAKVIKRFIKRQPQSVEMAKAIEIDDLEYDATPASPAFAEGPRLSRTEQIAQRLAPKPAPAELDPPDELATYADDEAEMAAED